MEFHEGINPELSLLAETKLMVEDAERATGKPIILRPDSGIHDRANAVFAASDTDETRHLIVYDPEMSRFANHIIPHELGHLMHYVETPKSALLLPVIRSDERNFAHAELEREIPLRMRTGNTPEEINAAADEWISGVVGQVTSYPADIAIERDLWDKHPSLRSSQRDALAESAKEAHELIQENAPNKIRNATNSMSYALIRTVSDFLDDPKMIDPYRGTTYEKIGEELLDIYKAIKPEALVAFSEVSHKWAKLLGIENWFVWVPPSKLKGNIKRVWE